jgi:hypothetical protein
VTGIAEQDLGVSDSPDAQQQLTTHFQPHPNEKDFIVKAKATKFVLTCRDKKYVICRDKDETFSDNKGFFDPASTLVMTAPKFDPRKHRVMIFDSKFDAEIALVTCQVFMTRVGHDEKSVKAFEVRPVKVAA